MAKKKTRGLDKNRIKQLSDDTVFFDNQSESEKMRGMLEDQTVQDAREKFHQANPDVDKVSFGSFDSDARASAKNVIKNLDDSAVKRSLEAGVVAPIETSAFVGGIPQDNFKTFNQGSESERILQEDLNLSAQGLSAEAAAYLEESGINQMTDESIAEESEPDKEIIVQNPANLMAEDAPERAEVDQAFKEFENKVSNDGWTKTVEEYVTPLRKKLREADLPEGGETKVLAADIGIGAMIDTVEDLGNAAIDAANWTDEWMQDNGYTEQDFVKDDLTLDYADKVWPEISGTTAESITRNLAGYLLPLSASAKLVKGGTALAKGAKMVGLNAGLNFVKQDPNGQNISNLIQENTDYGNFVTSYLAIDDTDSAIEARAKTAIESVLVDTIALGAGPAIKAGAQGTNKLAKGMAKSLEATKKSWKNSKMAKRIETATKEVEETFDSSATAARVNDDLLDLSADQPALNLVSLSRQKDIMGSLKKIVKDNPEVIQRGVKTRKELLGEATEVLETKELPEIFERAAAGTASEADIAAMEVVYDMAVRDHINTIRSAAKSSNVVDEVAVLESKNIVEYIGSLSKRVASDSGAKLKLQQHGIEITAPHVRRKQIANMAELTGRKDLKEYIKNLNDSLDVPEDQLIKMGDDIIQRGVGRNLFDAAMEVRVNGLLSSGKTQALSVGAALIRGPISVAERGIAALYTRGAAKQDKVFFGEMGVMSRAFLDEGTTQVLSSTAGLLDAMKLGHTALKTQRLQAAQRQVSETTADIATFFEAQGFRRTAITSESFGYGKDTLTGNALDKFGSITRIPSWLLSRGDQATGMMHYRMQVRSLAYREARAMGLRGDDMAKIVEDLSNTPLHKLRPQHKEIAKNLREKSILESNEARFLNETPGAFGKVNETFYSVAPLRMLIPFHRVDLNIVAQAIDRTPGLARFTERYKVAIEQGGAAAAEAKAKVAMGGSIASIGVLMASNGLITGDGPKNRDALKMLKATGWQPNSVRVGDKFYNYEKLGEPFNRILRLSATMADMSGYAYGEHANENIQKDYMDMGMSMAVAIAESGSPEFLNEGFGDIITAMEKPEGSIAQSVLEQLIVGQVPYSSLLRDLRKEVDPYRRETEGDPMSPWAGLEEISNEIKNIIPGMSEGLPPQRNIFAEPQVYPQGVGPDMISPVYQTKFKNDPVTNELVRLGVTGPLSHPEPRPGEEHLVMRMPSNIISVSVAGTSQNIQLNPEQYDRLVVLTSGEGLQGVRKTLKQALADEIENDYPHVPASMGGSDQAKRTVLMEIYNTYKGAASLQLQKEDVGIQEEMKMNMMKIQEAFGL